VAELADAADSKSAEALLRVGSTPSSGTLLFSFLGLTAEFFILLGFFSISASSTMTLDDNQ
jgi:hypothetical protein